MTPYIGLGQRCLAPKNGYTCPLVPTNRRLTPAQIISLIIDGSDEASKYAEPSRAKGFDFYELINSSTIIKRHF